MNDTELKCFIAVAETLNFTKASERLFFSVSTVTHHIQMLERELGTELFVRTKKMVELTESGKVFYVSAKQILMQQTIALRNLKEMRAERILRIGCTSNSEAFRLIPMLRLMKNQYPDVLPEIHVEDYDVILRRLEMESIHFAFGSLSMAENTGLKYLELCKLQIYAAFNYSHPFANRSSIRFEELNGHSLLMLSSRMIPFDRSNSLGDLFAAHIARNHDTVINLESDAFPLVIAGYGGFILPAYRVPPHIKELGISIVPIEELAPFSYGLIYKKCPDIKLGEFIVEECREICEKVYAHLR